MHVLQRPHHHFPDIVSICGYRLLGLLPLTSASALCMSAPVRLPLGRQRQKLKTFGAAGPGPLHWAFPCGFVFIICHSHRTQAIFGEVHTPRRKQFVRHRDTGTKTLLGLSRNINHAVCRGKSPVSSDCYAAEGAVIYMTHQFRLRVLNTGNDALSCRKIIPRD